MENMKIRDEELDSYRLAICEVSGLINARIDNLKTYLEEVCNNGVEEGVFHHNLALFADVLSGLDGEIDKVAENISSAVQLYQEKLDELDGSIY